MEARDLQAIETYEDWQRQEGIPVVGGFFVRDLNTLPLEPWKRKRGLGTFINLEGTGGTNDAYVCQIPPGVALNPQRHVFEEMILILRGRGATSVWVEGMPKVTYEWQQGSLFAIPLNAWHQHFNGQGDLPCRYLAVTNAPIVMALFHNLRFVVDNPFVFDDRFTGQEDYFSKKGVLYRHRGRANVWETNFVPDVASFQLHDRPERGAGGKDIHFELANNTMTCHISEFPVSTYKKAHRHGPGAHVVILSGEGFSLLWPEGGERVRVDWKPGSMVVPPNQWFHQHFNTGPRAARYLALRWGSRRFQMSQAILPTEASDVSEKLGGMQIEYEDEDPKIHEAFEEELTKSGARCRMRSMIPWCTST